MRNAVLLPQSNDYGKNLENTVFMHLYRNRLHGDKISYYQGNTECDFVLRREDKVVLLVQSSWSIADDETRGREVKGLLEASAATGCDNLLIITNDKKLTLDKKGETDNRFARQRMAFGRQRIGKTLNPENSPATNRQSPSTIIATKEKGCFIVV